MDEKSVPFFKLVRIEDNGRETIGTILDESGEAICSSLEPPWLNNQHNESCIPPGQYFCVPYESGKFHRRCFRLLHVPDRKDISMHPGNKVENTDGCILPGESAEKPLGAAGWWLNDSGEALDRLLELAPKGFYLRIEAAPAKVPA